MKKPKPQCRLTDTRGSCRGCGGPGQLKVSTLISASCPGWMKPMSRFDTMASISSRLSLGTTTIRGLRRRDHAADRVDRELLHHTVHRRGEKLKPGLLLGLDQLLGEPDRLLLRLDELVGKGTPIFSLRLAARFAKRGHGGVGFA